jgi:hypothetical protein
VHGKIVFVDETITGELALNQLQLSRKENPRSVLFRKSLIAGSLIFFSAGSFPFIAQAQESLYFVAQLSGRAGKPRNRVFLDVWYPARRERLSPLLGGVRIRGYRLVDHRLLAQLPWNFKLGFFTTYVSKPPLSVFLGALDFNGDGTLAISFPALQ